MNQYHCYSPHELTDTHWQAWAEIQSAAPALASPYFHPGFTRAVAAVRDDVAIGVVESQGRPVGFFPFQRAGWGVGTPVGGRLNDLHGMIARPETEWELGDLFAACRLAAWDFHEVLAGQSQWAPHHAVADRFHYLDLSQGFEAYQADRDAETDELRQTMRKWRKMERELAPLRFEFHTEDAEVFETLLAWKEEQYAATGYTNVFAFGWTVDLLRELLAGQTPDFGGVLSALHAGDRLIAVHYGLRSREVLHSWFPAYDKQLHKWSPGRLLLLALAREHDRLGITRIDLGRGTEQYKQSFGSAGIEVAEGAAEVGSAVTVVRQAWRSAKSWVRNSPVWTAAQYPAAWTRGFRDWLTFR